MKTSKPWVEALKVDPKDYNSWVAQAPTFSSLTFWCLEREKVPATKYLTWAREHYGLAVIKDNFFQDPANHEFWALIKSVANWSPAMIPLCEWDGIIFVACVEPPTEVNWSFPVRYLLASSDNLNRYWNDLQNPGSISARKIQQPAPAATPAPVAKVAPQPAAPQPAAPQPAAKPSTPTPMVAAQPTAPPPAEDAMEGLTLNIPTSVSTPEIEMPFGLNLNLGKAASNSNGMEGLKLNLPDDSSGINITGLSSTALKLTDEETPEGMANAQSHPKMQIMGGMEAPVADASETPHHLDAVSDAEVARDAEGRDGQNFKAFMEDSVVMQRPTENTFTGSFAAANLQVASPADALIDIKKQAPADISEAHDENEAVAWAFKKLKDNYSQMMILLFEGESARPWKWDRSWAPRSDAAFNSVNLSAPSLLRIVKRTKLPYHGHVVPSEANQSFFLEWGLSNLPAHATVLPLLLGSTPIGLLLCIGEVTANTPQTLVAADRIALKLVDRLSRFEAKAA